MMFATAEVDEETLLLVDYGLPAGAHCCRLLRPALLYPCTSQVWKWWPIGSKDVSSESSAEQGGASQARKLLRYGWAGAERTRSAGGLSQQVALAERQQGQLGAGNDMFEKAEAEEQQPAWAAELQRITQAVRAATWLCPVLNPHLPCGTCFELVVCNGSGGANNAAPA